MSTDIHELRHGYNMADLDRIARIAVCAAWSQATDARDRYEAAWHAIAEALYAANERPEPWELKQVGMAAVDEHGRADRRHKGYDHRNPDAGYEARRRFLQYWELDRHGCHSPEHAIVEWMAAWQIWPHLSDTDRRTIQALIAHDGDQLAAAAALGKSRSAYVTALSTARHKFLALWLEGETPQRRIWGKADIRRSSRYSGTALIRVRRQRARKAAA